MTGRQVTTPSSHVHATISADRCFMHLLRLFLRIVLPAGLVTSAVFWMVSQWGLVVVRLPLPTGNLHLRADHEGWVSQIDSTQSIRHPELVFHERPRTAGSWQDWMQDLAPVWLGSACVYADWQVSTSTGTCRFLLVGVKHYVVVLMSAAAVCMLIRYESLQKRNAVAADRVAEIES